MTFAAPVFAWVAAAAAMVTVALHLLAWRRPPETLLPTARFAPDAPVRTVSRAIRPADLALLALRVMMVLLVGGALAGPTFTPQRNGFAHVIVVDRSGAAPATNSIAESIRAMFREGDALVVFDSAAREIGNPTRDSIGFGQAPMSRGSLSAALIVAIRAANRLQREHDSVEIVIASPFGVGEADAATTSIRAAWPGAVRAIRVTGQPNDTTNVARPVVRAAVGDPVAAALALASGGSSSGGVRVVRDAMTADDTAWARKGNALVVWPASAVPRGWEPRAAADTAFGVVTSGLGAATPGGELPATVIAAFDRTVAPPTGRVIARWQDGQPAATEAPLGTGCVRSVAINVPSAGDLAVTPAFRRFAERLTAPCTQQRDWASLSDTAVAQLLAPRLASQTGGREASAGPAQTSRLAEWLLGFALVVAVAELVMRRGGSHATA